MVTPFPHASLSSLERRLPAQPFLSSICFQLTSEGRVHRPTFTKASPQPLGIVEGLGAGGGPREETLGVPRGDSDTPRKSQAEQTAL